MKRTNKEIIRSLENIEGEPSLEWKNARSANIRPGISWMRLTCKSSSFSISELRCWLAFFNNSEVHHGYPLSFLVWYGGLWVEVIKKMELLSWRVRFELCPSWESNSLPILRVKTEDIADDATVATLLKSGLCIFNLNFAKHPWTNQLGLFLSKYCSWKLGAQLLIWKKRTCLLNLFG